MRSARTDPGMSDHPAAALTKKRHPVLSSDRVGVAEVEVQVRRLRRQQIVGALTSHQREGAFWAINSVTEGLAGAAPTLPCPTDATPALAAVRTGLSTLPPPTRHRLVNWGYAATDTVLRTWFDPQLPIPDRFPFKVGVARE